MNLIYDDKLYKSGYTKYKNIDRSITNIINDLNNYIDSANEVDIPFEYDGVFKENLDNLKKYFSILSKKVKKSYDLVLRGKSIVERYNNGDLDIDVAIFLLNLNSEIYTKSFDGSRNSGNALIDDLDYSNIFDEGYTAQGITIIGDKVLITAYKDGSASKLFIFDINNKDRNYSVILDSDIVNGKMKAAHVGGITYDEENHVILITGRNGKINAYDFDAMEAYANTLFKNKKEGKNIEFDLNNNTYKSSIKLNSNISMKGDDGTSYNAATIFYDNTTKKLYLAQFANDAIIISGNIKYDKTTGTYSLANKSSAKLDNAVQGISIYHNGDKSYLVESRSYGNYLMNGNSVVTVRNISNGISNSTVVGSQKLSYPHSEGIQVDSNGKATVVFEKGGIFTGNYDKTETIDINDIIEENNGICYDLNINTDKYETKK